MVSKPTYALGFRIQQEDMELREEIKNKDNSISDRDIFVAGLEALQAKSKTKN